MLQPISLKEQRKIAMEIQVDSKILNLIASLETDLNKVIKEALTLWLKERIIICPISGQFCKHDDGPCNDCSVATK